MKRIYLLILVLGTMLPGVVSNVQANDYLEHSSHYTVQGMDNNVLRFTIPIWVYGAVNDYYLDADKPFEVMPGGDTYICYKIKGSDTEVRIATLHAVQYGSNDTDSPKGEGYMLVHKGSAIVRSTYSGEPVTLAANDSTYWKSSLKLKRKNDDGHKRITYITFDWYPNTELQGKEFTVGMQATICKKAPWTVIQYKQIGWSNVFEGGNIPVSPQLYTPYINMVDENGLSEIGTAAVQYTTMQEPISYYTSFDTAQMPTSDQMGAIIVPTKDSVQHGFDAKFKVYLDKEAKVTQTLTSNAIDIPAYHRIYNFKAEELKDTLNSMTGEIKLSWDIKTPEATDLVPGDIFEVQRATKSDFSDAQTIATELMLQDTARYTYTDNPLAVLGSDTVGSIGTLNMKVSRKDTLYDGYGQLRKIYETVLKSSKYFRPGKDIYYRIQRASSSTQGWNHDLAKTTSIHRNAYLAPLADTLDNYTKDPDYETNRKVHFNFKLLNQTLPFTVEPEDSCTKSQSESNKSYNIPVRIKLVNEGGLSTSDFEIKIEDFSGRRRSVNFNQFDTYVSTEIESSKFSSWDYYDIFVQRSKKEEYASYRVKGNEPVAVIINGKKDSITHKKYDLLLGTVTWTEIVYSASISLDSAYTAQLQDSMRVDPVPDKDSLCHVMYPDLVEKVAEYVSDTTVRCNWDRNAVLYLCRRTIETGDSIEIPIPQDSITRLSDGSWKVHMTDIADRSCVHYEYSVRIDQSNSSLKVVNLDYLKPKKIDGPDLYYNAVAQIEKLTASQGDDRYGVQLAWEKSAGGVDEYTVERRPAYSEEDFSYLATTTDIGYRDETGKPGMDYEYRVTASFTCNGSTTANSDTVTGRRSPFGKISGRLHYEDGTGCAQTTVQLLAANAKLFTETDAAGNYTFDSLLYYWMPNDPKITLKYINEKACPKPDTTTYIQIKKNDGTLIQDWTNMTAGAYYIPSGSTVRAFCTTSGLKNTNDTVSVVITGNGTLYCSIERYLIVFKKFYLRYSPSSDAVTPEEVGQTEFTITPMSQTAQFRFNNTSMASASVTLSAANPVAENLDFDNISSARLSGRVLYKNSSIPVRDAFLFLNGDTVKTGAGVLRTDVSGNFTIRVPNGAPFTLRAAKEGHSFEDGGWVRIDGDSLLTLSSAQDGVRIWDITKVRLAGRVTGGKNQASKPLGFGLSTNNLGDNIQLILELEGDNTSHIVRVPEDLTIDSLPFRVSYPAFRSDSVVTNTLYEKKRITIYPDPKTGEYAADLFPVRYKVVQATADGYSTLFMEGKTSEVLDLSDGAVHADSMSYEGLVARWNERYNVTYRSPIDISCIQMLYGMPQEFYGEKLMIRQNIMNEQVTIPLAEQDSTGAIHYVFGAPVFHSKKYTFRITAHEDYYYNNERSGKHEEVRINGGTLKVYNGLHEASNTQIITMQLNAEGQADVTLPVDNVSYMKTGEDALRTLDISVESDGKYVEKQAFRAHIMGNRAKGRDFFASYNAGVQLLDILRDPPGAKSYAYIEKGTTYQYNHSFTLNGKFGITFDIKYGSANTADMGTFQGSGLGIWAGYTMSGSSVNNFPIPLTSSVMYKHQGSYSFTTNERIETSSDQLHVGSMGDVYIGVAQSVYFGLTDAVKPIDEATFNALHAQLADSVGKTGSSHILAQGQAMDGKQYYLVVGNETEVGSYVDGTFAYSQEFIINSLLPRLLRERDALLLTGDSADVQAIANARNKVVYWSKVLPTDTTYAITNYVKLYPATGSDRWVNVDEVEQYNKLILNWVDLIRQNEQEKLTVKYGVNADQVGNYSISNSIRQSYSETYNYSSTIALRWDYLSSAGAGGSLNFKNALSGLSDVAASKLKTLYTTTVEHGQQQTKVEKNTTEMTFETPGAKWSFVITPVLNVDFDRDPNKTTTHKKTEGFVMETGDQSYMNVTVARLREPSNWFNEDSEDERDFISGGNDYNGSDYQYGSFVYQLNGGASKCPWEGPEESIFYTDGDQPAIISHGTLKLENPQIEINVHEQSDIAHDKPAVFNLRLTNELEQDLGTRTMSFTLRLDESSNPKGAKIYIDGLPLTGDGRTIRLATGQIVNKTMEVYAGGDYDYEDITIQLASTCDVKAVGQTSFSVHYMPVSCEVNISSPHNNWVLNTLSPRDSVGYYLPVVIDGFDVNYSNFDHIELQYKQVKQSDDAWVNVCSYYADDSLYAAASGSKAMITAGRIENIHFYGGRDPMEQQYELRAVSFCRHGSSFITRNSTVLTGIKDTRIPVLFGAPQPVNNILGVGDNLQLRFSEAIAGNYLDEDNNFQLIGVTNKTGITASASLHFTGQDDSYARTKATRSLYGKAYSIDLMVKPADRNGAEIFFRHVNAGDSGMVFGKTAANRLYVEIGTSRFESKVLDEPMTDFTRVIACIDPNRKQVRFYAGTKEFTDPAAPAFADKASSANWMSPLTFGQGFNGNMLEARVWSKALTSDEIANTHMHYLSGYEQELLAYYRMNDGRGTALTDLANGATLYLEGASWIMPKGISLRMTADQPVELDNRYLTRSSKQDETLLFWFRTDDNKDGNLFSAGRSENGNHVGFALRIENEQLVLLSDSNKYPITNYQSPITDGAWHHLALSVNRTYNNVSLFLDNNLVLSLASDELCAISGEMLLGGFNGNIDEFILFEQALPKALIEEYSTISPAGDEMGLMAYLPFSISKENNNSIVELVFSPNDRRVFKDSEGNVVNKELPLIVGDASKSADKTNYAPLRDRGQMTKMNFNWTYDNTELLINLNMADREINKQTMFITVRDVEDLNGNPMASPVTWSAFVDRNSLKWDKRELEVTHLYSETDIDEITEIVSFTNTSGKRHQFYIESLPEWLTVTPSYGSVEPTGYANLRFGFNPSMPVGEYSDIIYLTDEDGLSEPFFVHYSVKAECPYDEVDKHKYPLNMAVCGQVMLNGHYDTDRRDRVIALYRNECIGNAQVDFNETTNTTDLYLTVYGNESMNNKPVNFVLWQASTGNTLILAPDRDIVFRSGDVIGCSNEEPVMLVTSGSETQNINLQEGWSWISTNLRLNPDSAPLNKVMTVAEPWKEGDLIKNPESRQFSTYSEVMDVFMGTLSAWDYTQTYMVYSAQENILRLNGENLLEYEMKLTFRGSSDGSGQWSPLPFLLNRNTSVAETMAGYYEYATPGDIIKSHDAFATFSTDRKWIGNLKTMRPGEGYFLRRLAPTDVTVPFYNQPASAGTPKRSVMPDTPEGFHTSSATNMTMIAMINDGNGENGENGENGVLKVYLGDDLVGKAEPINPSLSSGAASPLSEASPLYFLTIQSDKVGELRFETEDGTPLASPMPIRYEADAHHGSLQTPVILKPGENTLPYKILEDDHVVIIRNNEKYSITGTKL